ncbi:MAG: BREX system Lon protease-like protein BrxL, partial [Thermoguttaceae bacterium]|nr:BREX system Lon protease-like protein BrxL [Thermoguttaceae bacterium]
RIKDDVINTSGGWGLIQLGYLPPSKGENPKGKITLVKFKNFCPYTVNLDVYREARSHFTVEEWTDILLGAIDYNPDGYDDFDEKHMVLTRLLPFIEPRLNLIELAPKGTGKSYLFGTIGKYGWLVSGGSLTRAKLFYDIQKKQDGLVKNNDFVAMDEIQSIHFPDPSEMQGALKAYMEAGEATFGDQHVVGSAGIILLGNIPQDDMNVSANMFRSLPMVFQESALLDRFHGFIQGRQIPRMSERLKVNGWALNTEYFSEIMHLMRSQSECILYRSVIEELIEYPSNADTRDTQAILRICTAYLKLFFPHVTKADQINIEEFKRFCFHPAIEMRRIIRNQLQIIDPKEFRGKNLAAYSIKKKYE